MEQIEKGQEIKKEILIRPAKPDDALDIQKVYKETWNATYPETIPGVTKEDIEEYFKDAFSEETLCRIGKLLQNLPENKKFIVAEVNGKIVGLCTLTKSDSTSRIQSFYILPEYQGKRIGTSLWQEIKKYINYSKPVILNVAKQNKSAINFYESLGFRKTETIVEPEFEMPITKTKIEEVEMSLQF